jgi:hypothetical protein
LRSSAGTSTGGEEILELNSTYIYGDYCSGEVNGFRFRVGRVREKSLLLDSGLRITSFGQDQQGELYALAEDCGVYKLTANR